MGTRKNNSKNQVQRNNEDKQNKKDSSNALIYWFVASIVAIVILRETGWILAIIGQLIFGFGIMAIRKEKNILKNIVFFYFPFLGLVMIIGGLISVSGVEGIPDNMAFITAGIMIVLFFFLIGFDVSVISLIIDNKRKKRCCFSVNAEVVDYKMKKKQGEYSSTPVYKFRYKSKFYTADDGFYIRGGLFFSLPELGEEVIININEKDPTEIYVERKFLPVFKVVCGSLFMIFAIVLLVLLLMRSV